MFLAFGVTPSLYFLSKDVRSYFMLLLHLNDHCIGFLCLFKKWVCTGEKWIPLMFFIKILRNKWRSNYAWYTSSPDLKAFERRLTEYIACLQPATGRWRMILIVVSVCTATGAWNWLIDPETQKVSFLTSLWNHPFFTISCITLIGLFFAGIHKRVVAPSIIAARCRTVLAEYNMSCDDTGKLILKPRPHVQ